MQTPAAPKTSLIRQQPQAWRRAADWRLAFALVTARTRLGVTLARRNGRLHLDIRIERGEGVVPNRGSNG